MKNETANLAHALAVRGASADEISSVVTALPSVPVNPLQAELERLKTENEWLRAIPIHQHRPLPPGTHFVTRGVYQTIIALGTEAKVADIHANGEYSKIGNSKPSYNQVCSALRELIEIGYVLPVPRKRGWYRIV